MMKVEILKAVLINGVLKRSGVFDVPEFSAKHWIATGAARPATPVETPPLTQPIPPGKKG
jgi:hypothetical protein